MVELGARDTALIAPRPGRAAAVAAALQDRFGCTMPGMGEFTRSANLILARTAPHQIMAMRDEPGLFDALEAALAGEAGVIDLSDARIGVVLSGPSARERLMGLLAVDLAAMRPGRCVQTVMAHIGVLVFQVDGAPTYEVQCSTSYRSSFLRAFELAGLPG